MTTEGSEGNKGKPPELRETRNENAVLALGRMVNTHGDFTTARALEILERFYPEGNVTAWDMPSPDLPTEPGWYHVLATDLMWLATVKLDKEGIMTRNGDPGIYGMAYYSGRLFLRIPTPMEMMHDDRDRRIKALERELDRKQAVLKSFRKAVQGAALTAIAIKAQVHKLEQELQP